MKTPEEVEAQLTLEIEAALKEGWKLVNGSFGSCALKTCCVLTAKFAVLSPPEQLAMDSLPLSNRVEEFGIANQWLWSLVDGFDDHSPRYAEDRDWFAIGVRLRKKFRASMSR
jgi:hypothetical protein